MPVEAEHDILHIAVAPATLNQAFAPDVAALPMDTSLAEPIDREPVGQRTEILLRPVVEQVAHLDVGTGGMERKAAALVEQLHLRHMHRHRHTRQRQRRPLGNGVTIGPEHNVNHQQHQEYQRLLHKSRLNYKLQIYKKKYTELFFFRIFALSFRYGIKK